MSYHPPVKHVYTTGGEITRASVNLRKAVRASHPRDVVGTPVLQVHFASAPKMISYWQGRKRAGHNVADELRGLGSVYYRKSGTYQQVRAEQMLALIPAGHFSPHQTKPSPHGLRDSHARTPEPAQAVGEAIRRARANFDRTKPPMTPERAAEVMAQMRIPAPREIRR